LTKHINEFSTERMVKRTLKSLSTASLCSADNTLWSAMCVSRVLYWRPYRYSD